jgi:hypothetical protein
MAEEKEKNTLEKLNEAFLDFTENVFGESGREFMEKTQKQVNEFNVAAIKAFVDFGDQILENTKLGENEMVQKSSNTVKDLLRQYNLLEEESEEDF